MADHTFLSASASERWLHCPPSARLCEQFEDTESEYALQGTEAHSLCQYLLEKALHPPPEPSAEIPACHDQEMRQSAEDYVSFVMAQVAEARSLCSDPLVCVEQRVDFSEWVPDGFGTADALIVADDLLCVTDFKYGVGCLVSAAGEDGDGNPQLKCYALGALDTFGSLYGIRRIRLSIFQPRRENVDSYELSAEELLRWAEGVLAPAAALAFAGQGEFSAGPHCRFCRAKSVCRKRADQAMDLAKFDFALPPTLDADEIAAILPRIDPLVSWAEDIKTYALRQALAGVRFPGFKLVAGRSNRRYADEEAVARVVSAAGYDPWDKKLAGITEMTGRLGKKRFDQLLSGLLVKPEGKPVLVPAEVPRPELNNMNLEEN